MHSLRNPANKKQGPSQRQKRVNEVLKQALSQVLMRGESRSELLMNTPLTISGVNVSPDLRNATCYFMPLGGENRDEIFKALKEEAPHLRHLISSMIELRYVPKLRFELDTSFDEAESIYSLLNDSKTTESVA